MSSSDGNPRKYEKAVCKKEPTCHHWWVTTASGYFRLIILDVSHFDDDQRAKLVKLAYQIVSVYVPSFVSIHLKPTAAEGPAITLFQRSLLLSYREIDSELANLVFQYSSEHAVQWLTPINVALSVFAEVPLNYSIETATTGLFPQFVDAKS